MATSFWEEKRAEAALEARALGAALAEEEVPATATDEGIWPSLYDQKNDE